MRRTRDTIVRRMEQIEKRLASRPEQLEGRLQAFLGSLSDAELLQLQRDLREDLERDAPGPEAPADNAGSGNLSAEEARELLEFLTTWREEFQRAYREELETLRAAG